MKLARPIVLCLAVCAAYAAAACAQDDEAADSTRPGLVTKYTGPELNAAGSDVVIEAIEPVPRLFGPADQSPRVGIPAGGFQVAWNGLLVVPYQGAYTLTARRNTLADFSLSIDGKPAPLGTAVELPQGPVAIQISGRQAAGEAALELWWRSNYFADEPIEPRHFRHDPAAAASRQAAQRTTADRGAVLVETHGCFRCHEAPQGVGQAQAAGLSPIQLLPGPNLHDVAKRVNAPWLVDWIKNPHSMRADTAMPNQFTDSREDELAARTIAAYLMSLNLAGEKPPAGRHPAIPNGDALQGDASFKALGCAACHGPPPNAASAAELVSGAPVLDKLAEKWTATGLAGFLQKPLESRAHGRMPDFGLTADESANLAAYLLGRADAGKPGVPPQLIVTDEELNQQWRQLSGGDVQALPGDRAQHLAVVATAQMAARQCASCHEVPAGRLAMFQRRPTGSPILRFAITIAGIEVKSPPALKSMNAEQLGRGCLADGDNQSTRAPRFGLSKDDRAALVAYFKSLGDDSLRGNTSTSLADRLRVDLAVLNCVRCHDNEGQGGESLAALIGGDDHAKYYRPPMLTRVGERVRPERLKEWIGYGARSKALRPWVGARMPGFGPRGPRIAAALAARDGATGPAVLNGPAAPVVGAPQSHSEHAQTGRFLVGTKALACINCHTLGGKLLAGQPDATTRGPDLTVVAEHLRPEYFQRWVMNPARIRPGTKMPQAIQPDGTVAVASLKSLPPGSAMNALWSYLSQGASAPAPADEPTVLVLPQVGAPVVQRGEVNVGKADLGDGGKFPRAVAMGFADGTLLFDADKLTTVAAWYGSFIKPASSPYFGLWWSREGAEPDVFAGQSHPLSFELPDARQRQAFALPLDSDPNIGTRFEGHQVGCSSVRLKYRVLVAGHKVTVTEDVRLESRPDWQGFARAFRFEGLPAGARASLALPAGSDAKAYTPSALLSPRSEVVPDRPVLTYKVKDQVFAAVKSAGGKADWDPADDSRQEKATQGKPAANLPAAQLVSAPASDQQPAVLRVDLWRYRGKNAAPTAGELDFLIANPPLLDDDFERPVAPPAPVAVAQLIDAAADDAPQAPARTRPAVNAQENIDEFALVIARFVRFKVLKTTENSEPGIDELEIYGADPKLNLALSGQASASTVISGYKIHQIPHLNDGKLGNSFSWIGGEGGKAWVMVELPHAAEVRKVVWARDRTGVCKDRLAVGYQVEVSVDGVNFRKVSDDSDRITTPGAGVITADASPGYFMQALELPFPDCRMSDIAFADDGTMYAIAMTEGQIWRTKTPPADRPKQIRWQRFASGLYHPIGIQIVDGRVFVAQKPEITELVDRDGDGTADEFRTLASGWSLSTGWHEYTFGLAVDPQKYLWFALNTGYFWTNPGYVNPGKWRGSIMRLSYEADKLEAVAKGCRVPNGIVCGTDDQIFYSDNQGDWIQSCKLAHVVPGRFYGHPEYKEDALPAEKYPDGRSSVWMPYNNSRSTSGPVCDKTGGKFGPFANQMFVGDVGYGGNPGIMRVALEKVDGEYQGAVLRFVDGQPLGCERMKFGPDNQLYMASLTTGLTRLKYLDETPLAIERVNIRPAGAGFVLKFTRPLAANTTPKPGDFRVRRYHYLYTGNYGSPEADVAMVSVSAAELSADRTQITLSFPVATYPIGMVYEINAGKLADDDGHTLLHNEAWYTVHRLPK